MLTEYLQGIYVSDINTAFDKIIYQKYNIDIVINCTIDFGFLDINIKKIRIPLSNDLNYHTDIKLLNQNLHAGTLSFEMSYDKEKIITNCGSIEKRIGKKPEFLRYSAAHSTIILNNTNISELVEKKSYKRIPQIIEYNYFNHIC